MPATSILERARRGLRGIRALWRRRLLEREMDDEMRAHLEFETEALVRDGMTPIEAARRAHLAFGGVQRTKESVLRERAFSWLAILYRDCTLSIRRLRRAPIGAIAVILITGIGIAGVTTVFSLVNTAWFRPLPYDHDDRLVKLAGVSPQRFLTWTMPVALFDGLRRDLGGSAAIAAFHERQVQVRIGNHGSLLHRTALDATALDVLHGLTAHGRPPTAAEYADASPVVLISDSLWRHAFGASDSALGAAIPFEGRTHRIIGVMPPRFRFDTRSDLWVPFTPRTPEQGVGERGSARDLATVEVVARLGSAVMPEAFDLRTQEVMRDITGRDPALAGWRVLVRPLQERGQSRSGYSVAAAFFTLTAILLLVVCANVTNLLLARTLAQRRELAIAAALGASRGRLAVQLLAEHAILGIIAGLIGVALSAIAVEALLAIVPTQGLPGWLEFGIDWRVLVFAVLVSLATILLIGILPSREGMRADPLRVIAEGGHAGVTPQLASRRTAALVRIQLALSLMLLAGGTMIATAYWQVVRDGIPRDSERAVDVFLRLDDARTDDHHALRLLRDGLWASLRQDPRVAVAVRYGEPLVRRDHTQGGPVFVPGDTRLHSVADAPQILTSSADPSPWILVADDAYHVTHGQRIVAGHTFDPSDSLERDLVMIIPASLARAVWGDAEAVGQRVRIGRGGSPARIIGVVSDRSTPMFVDGRITTGDRPILYLSQWQVFDVNSRILVRGVPDADAARQAVQQAIARADPEAEALMPRTLAEDSERHMLPLRMFANTLFGIAVTALVIVLVGLYGLASLVAERRRRELGIRLALGATRRDIERLLLFDALRQVVGGVALGAVLAGVFVWALSHRVPTAPTNLAISAAATVLVLLAAVVAASWIPAYRAASVPSGEVLRSS